MPPALQLKGVSKVYGDKIVALADINLEIGHGEYVALSGPSGSGKTTLLNIIGLLDTATAGVLWFDGNDTSHWRDRDRSQARAHALGFVFQSYHLFEDRSVFENIEIGLVHQHRPADGRTGDITSCLRAVGLQHRASALARTLSGGERQRVAIARAMARHPSVLLCDEPVGNLDDANAVSVLDEIDRIHRSGVTVVLATHEARSLERSQRVVLLSDGRTDGTHDT